MARQHESKYKFTYRRTNKLTPDTIRKLEEAASVRLNDKESSAHAEISRDTYYRWMKTIPGLSDRLEDLRTHPTIRAKRRIVSQLDIDTGVAFRYLEKESPEEYGDRLKLEHSGAIANNETDYVALDEARKRIKDEVRKDAQKKIASKT